MDGNDTKLLELLRSQHTFPGPYQVKFIGAADDDFVGRLVAAVTVALQATEPPPYTTQPSRNQAYVSVTLMPIVSSAEQVLAVYAAARGVKGLKASL